MPERPSERTRRPRKAELVAEPQPLDPPAWTLTLAEFRTRLGELTLVKLAISPCHLWDSTEPNGSYQSYLIASDITCIRHEASPHALTSLQPQTSRELWFGGRIGGAPGLRGRESAL